MSHYDSYREAHYAKQRADALKHGRRTINARLRKIAAAMQVLGIHGASDIEEAIKHLCGDRENCPCADCVKYRETSPCRP